MPVDWHGEGDDAEAIVAVMSLLQEADFKISSPALMQRFEGTSYARVLAQAEAQMLTWGESFDVAAEFAGLIGKLDEGQIKQQLQPLQLKAAQGGLSGMSDQERDQYRRLCNTKPLQRLEKS